MLTKPQRFHGHNSLRPVYNKGKAVYSRSMKILWQTTNRDSSRAAVVVSKKVHKSAVVRNRIRRRVYTHLRKLFDSSQKKIDVVVVVNDAGLASTPEEQIARDITAFASTALQHTKESKQD